MRKITWSDIFLILVGKRIKYRVRGNSMLPAFRDGDIVLVKPGNNFKVGDIVLAKHPYKQNTKILKRVSSISEDGRLGLVGDNPEESTDSRTFGNIPVNDVIGKLV